MSHKKVLGYLVFRKVMIHNANAISSPITYGFPAVTGFLGAFHAMSRQIKALPDFSDYGLGGVLLACHDCQVQAYRPNRYRDYTFNQSRNPIKKDGKTASIIEEGKCHLVMSFAVEVLGEDNLSAEHTEQLVNTTQQWIQQNRMAGGSVQGFASSEPVQFLSGKDSPKLATLMLPAFVLMEAQDNFAQLITNAKQTQPDMTALDVLIDVCTLHHIPEVKSTGSVKWLPPKTIKEDYGWLVPMPIGYQGISERYEPGTMQNVRNPEYPSQYVETVYGLGKWVYPQRLANDIEQAFWRYQHDETNHLYLVTQN